MGALHRHTDLPSRSVEETRLVELARLVGDGQTLLRLRVDPLPDEPMELVAVPPDLTRVVTTIADLVKEFVGPRLSTEERTACHRALVRLAEQAPGVLRRRAPRRRWLRWPGQWVPGRAA